MTAHNMQRTLTLGEIKRLLILTSSFLLLGFVAPAVAQCTYAVKGKISRTFYRIPYGNNEQIWAGSQYFTHGGGMDIIGQEPPHTIVAAASGVIEGLNDANNECGFHGAFCCCVNWIGIRHANNEISRYYHIRQNSATNLGLAPGLFVSQGQQLGIEGDVGITAGTPGTSPPRTGPCAPVLPPDYPAEFGCQDHLHFAVFRGSTGELLVPMTCDIPGNRYTDQTTYTAGNCAAGGCPGSAQQFSNITLSGLGTARVYQNAQSITATTLVVQNQASAVFHAAQSVRLLPGFQAGVGGGYFRAEIGACNATAVSQDNAIATTTWQPVCCPGGCPSPLDGDAGSSCPQLDDHPDDAVADQKTAARSRGISSCGLMKKLAPN